VNFEAWSVFALFWVLFVTTPGPNAVNCIGNGMTLGFARSLWGVAGILTQATLFLFLSAAGVTALLAASPGAFLWAKLAGAAVLIWFGMRGCVDTARSIREQMTLIVPTAPVITAASDTVCTGIGAGLGRTAMGAVLNLWFRRFMSAAFVIYGLLLGSSALPGRS
jgi:homoserine/homoserine lactone efflux protein